MKKEFLFSIFIPLVFFGIAITTISHYGVNFDESPHFRRGQGYLHFFFTGKKDYSDLNPSYRRSSYQDTNEDGNFYLDADKLQSHPPLNDTLAALTNFIFYQQLNLLGDVESHHLFSILAVTLLIFSVYKFTRDNYGRFAGIIAAIAVSTYPVFLAETHFNVKDPPEASFFAMTIISFWYAVTQKKARYILLSSILCAVALGTKFNIVFLPFILLPWFISFGKSIFHLPKRMYISLLVFPIIVIAIFLLTNPNIWVDTVKRISTMVNFYLDSGTKLGSGDYQPEYILFGNNTYPILAVLFETPLITLFLGIVGIIVSSPFLFKEKHKTRFLVSLWLLVPILRVTLPGTIIYGGLRHIFEFIPALAIFSGIGAAYLVTLLNKKIGSTLRISNNTARKLCYIIVLLLFVPIILKIISIHPNENVYFNSLIGGLKGASKKNFPYAGSTVGNTYLQGALWLNKHAEKNSCVATPLAHRGNIPPDALRYDMEFNNTCLSGPERAGEYAMDMVYNGYFNYWYGYAYYATYLFPVYEIKVEDVVIFQVFKNDIAHSKKQLIRQEQIEVSKVKQEGNVISISLPRKVYLSALNLHYDVSQKCSPISNGFLVLSTDNRNWNREPDPINVSLGKENYVPSKKVIERKFAAKPGRYINIVTDLEKDCTVSINKLEVYYHPDVAL